MHSFPVLTASDLKSGKTQNVPSCHSPCCGLSVLRIGFLVAPLGTSTGDDVHGVDVDDVDGVGKVRGSNIKDQVLFQAKKGDHDFW